MISLDPGAPGPVSMRDLPANHFPFTVSWFREADDVLLGKVTVSGPGALRVPAFGVPARARVRYANGQVFEADSRGEVRELSRRRRR